MEIWDVTETGLLLTPNIDHLAEMGLRFTDFHSNGPMCTPTRAAFMTGMYQHRLGAKFEAALSGKTERDQGMPFGALTIAEVLKEAGYATGMFGKWHLGYMPPYLPHDQGFDEFRGLGSGDGDHHTHVDRWGREDWWHNNKPEMEDGYSTDLITRHSAQFIRDHRKDPFFYTFHTWPSTSPGRVRMTRHTAKPGQHTKMINGVSSLIKKMFVPILKQWSNQLIRGLVKSYRHWRSWDWRKTPW